MWERKPVSPRVEEPLKNTTLLRDFQRVLNHQFKNAFFHKLNRQRGKHNSDQTRNNLGSLMTDEFVNLGSMAKNDPHKEQVRNGSKKHHQMPVIAHQNNQGGDGSGPHNEWRCHGYGRKLITINMLFFRRRKPKAQNDFHTQNKQNQSPCDLKT